MCVPPVHRALRAADLPHRRQEPVSPGLLAVALARGGWRRRGIPSGSVDRACLSGRSSHAARAYICVFALERRRRPASPARWRCIRSGASILAAIILGEPIGLNLALARSRSSAHLDRNQSPRKVNLLRRDSPAPQPDMSERIGVLDRVLSSTFGGTPAAVARYVIGARTRSRSRRSARHRSRRAAAARADAAHRLRAARSDRHGLLGVMFFAVFFVFYNIALGFTTTAPRRARALDPAALDDGDRCLLARNR